MCPSSKPDIQASEQPEGQKGLVRRVTNEPKLRVQAVLMACYDMLPPALHGASHAVQMGMHTLDAVGRMFQIVCVELVPAGSASGVASVRVAGHLAAGQGRR